MDRQMGSFPPQRHGVAAHLLSAVLSACALVQPAVLFRTAVERLFYRFPTVPRDLSVDDECLHEGFEFHDVAVLDDVFFAFGAELT